MGLGTKLSYAAYQTIKEIQAEQSSSSGSLLWGVVESRVKNYPTDKELQRKVSIMVYDAKTQEDHDRIWKIVEEFKRDNPHIVKLHEKTVCWNLVGEERFPINPYVYVMRTGKRMKKDDHELLGIYQNRMISLLMNTYGKYSRSEAYAEAKKGTCLY